MLAEDHLREGAQSPNSDRIISSIYPLKFESADAFLDETQRYIDSGGSRTIATIHKTQTRIEERLCAVHSKRQPNLCTFLNFCGKFLLTSVGVIDFASLILLSVHVASL